MININPITTSFLTAAEFDSGVDATKPFKYVLEPDGSILYVTNMSADRCVIESKTKIPGMATGKECRDEVVQPLAYGLKMPEEFFLRIERFFLDVLGKTGSTTQLEAQIFVIWNETRKEYRLYVPEQQVSAAAVRYDISGDLASDDIIIMDVHSHNNMGAFYSGTDNADDKKNTWISGVFGKISSNLEYLFRFNDGAGNHYDLDYEDIFDVQEVVNPGEWLERVQIQRFGSRAYIPGKSAFGGTLNTQSMVEEESLGLETLYSQMYPEAEEAFGNVSTSSINDDIISDLVEGIEDVISEHDDKTHGDILDEVSKCLRDDDYLSHMACHDVIAIQNDFMMLHNYLEGFDKPSAQQAIKEARK